MCQKQEKMSGKHALNKISVINCLKLLKIQITNNFQISQCHLIGKFYLKMEEKNFFFLFFSKNPNVRILPLFEFWKCLRRTQNAITHRFRRRFPISISISTCVPVNPGNWVKAYKFGYRGILR